MCTRHGIRTCVSARDSRRSFSSAAASAPLPGTSGRPSSPSGTGAIAFTCEDVGSTFSSSSISRQLGFDASDRTSRSLKRAAPQGVH